MILLDSNLKEAWIGLARALKGQGRHGAADIAAKKALRRSEFSPQMQEELLIFRERFGTISDDIAVTEGLLKKLKEKEDRESSNS